MIGDGEAPSIVPGGGGPPAASMIQEHHILVLFIRGILVFPGWIWTLVFVCQCFSPSTTPDVPLCIVSKCIESSPCGENGAGKIGIFLFSNQPSFLWSHIPLGLCMIFISRNLNCQRVKSRRVEESKKQLACGVATAIGRTFSEMAGQK